MKVTVCEMSNQPARFAQDWKALCDHVKSAGSDLVLFPEMPFYLWKLTCKLLKRPRALIPDMSDHKAPALYHNKPDLTLP